LIEFSREVSEMILEVEVIGPAQKKRLEVYGAYEIKDILKGRGYKWNGARKFWYVRLDNEKAWEEIKYLRTLAHLILYPYGIREARWLQEHGLKVEKGKAEF